MRESERIQRQMKQAFEGGAWHGPALLEVLDGVDAKIAAARPVPGAHSIWELAEHICATQQILLRRIAGESAGTKEEEFWTEPPAPTDAAWAETVQRLTSQESRLQETVGALGDQRLDEPFMAKGTSAYNNLHGHAQHNLYHAGQIALLKKMIRGG